MIDPLIPLMGGQPVNILETASNGMQFGQGLRQMLAGRQIGNMQQIDDEVERKAFANNSMFSRELNAQLKADALAKQKMAFEQQKGQAEIGKMQSETFKNMQSGKGEQVKNAQTLLAAGNQALYMAAQNGDLNAVKLALNNSKAAGGLDDATYSQFLATAESLANEPEKLKAFARDLQLSYAKDPEKYSFTTADNRLDNVTSVQNNQLNNQTSVDNSIRSVEASKYGVDVAASTADKNRQQSQSQFETKLNFDQQQADIKNGQGEVKELGGRAYIVYKDGTAAELVDKNGQKIMAKPKLEPSIRTGVAELTGANDQLDGAIANLKRAQDLSKQGIYDGYTSGMRSDVAGFFGGSEQSRRTQEYNNVIMAQALASLKATFGGSPTEGERAILLKIQASSDYPPDVRDAILKEAIIAAENKKASNNKQMVILRGDQSQQPEQYAVTGKVYTLAEVKDAAQKKGISPEEMVAIIEGGGGRVQ